MVDLCRRLRIIVPDSKFAIFRKKEFHAIVQPRREKNRTVRVAPVAGMPSLRACRHRSERIAGESGACPPCPTRKPGRPERGGADGQERPADHAPGLRLFESRG